MNNLNQTAVIKSEQMKQATLQVTGKQEFMGKEIPVVLGGFGKGSKCVSDKTIAEIHGMEVRHVRELINRNAKRFVNQADILDLKGVVQNDTSVILQSLGYSKQQITQAEHIYILSERGYAKLIKIMDSDSAWEVHDRLMDDYFKLREESKAPQASCIEDALIQSLQEMKNVKLQLNQNSQAIEVTSQRVDRISDIVALSTSNWRQDAKELIGQIALTWGGYDYIREVNRTIYDQLNNRMGVKLKQRQTNKRDRMAREGVCESTRDKVTIVDVIADDKKLIEGYVAIVKEMAIGAGVANTEATEVNEEDMAIF